MGIPEIVEAIDATHKVVRTPDPGTPIEFWRVRTADGRWFLRRACWCGWRECSFARKTEAVAPCDCGTLAGRFLMEESIAEKTLNALTRIVRDERQDATEGLDVPQVEAVGLWKGGEERTEGPDSEPAYTLYRDGLAVLSPPTPTSDTSSPPPPTPSSAGSTPPPDSDSRNRPPWSPSTEPQHGLNRRPCSEVERYLCPYIKNLRSKTDKVRRSKPSAYGREGRSVPRVRIRSPHTPFTAMVSPS